MEIKEFVAATLAAGKTKEQIFSEALIQGFKVEEINLAFAPKEELEPKAPEDVQRSTISIVLTIAAILVGVGIFSFVAANWEGMGKASKVLILLVSMLGVDGLGWYLKEKKAMAKSASALYFLGTLIYGASIFLVAQIFNIRANWPDGFMLWMIGAIIMAYATEMYSLLILGALTGGVAIFGQPVILLEDLLSLHSFALTSLTLLIITTAAAFATGFVIRNKIPEEQKKYF